VNEKDNRATEPVALSTAGIRQGYSHYHKPCPYDFVDVYRVLEMFGVTDPCLQHAIKKLLVAGGRGQKDIRKDVAEPKRDPLPGKRVPAKRPPSR
jgi:hypothetical protein